MYVSLKYVHALTIDILVFKLSLLNRVRLHDGMFVFLPFVILDRIATPENS